MALTDGGTSLANRPPNGGAEIHSPLSLDVTVALQRSAEEPGGERMRSQLELFEEIILPHLDAAYNLARWWMRNDQDAEDVAQESYLRAFRFFDSYKGGDAKAWLLAIVRNTCRTWRRRSSRESASAPFDEVEHSLNAAPADPEQRMAEREKTDALKACIEKLPIEFREVLIMRELEEMSYQQIAGALGVALGTVMSRLSRARKRLEQCAGTRMLGASQ